jgi:hypothetical protein
MNFLLKHGGYEWSAFFAWEGETDWSNSEVHMKGLEIAKFWPFDIWK